jgi:hypothetical protein
MKVVVVEKARVGLAGEQPQCISGGGIGVIYNSVGYV